MEEDDFVFVDSTTDEAGLAEHDPFYYPTSNQGKASILDNFSIQHWYPKFAEQTFYTKFMPLNSEHVSALIAAYKEPIRGDKVEEIMKGLNHVIEEVKTHTGCKNVFVRLGSISPKDAVFSSPKTLEQLTTKMVQEPTQDMNLKMTMLQEVTHNALKSGLERFGQFIKLRI
eukprot:TRINITY_DN7092_c0_g1_i2.p1 TRINITY_DN7092_c0_g1~~TRINITY_DN7092_c0_g1_i2.p1  ORF type:complete len:183 (+),score=37.82 TRINITY_DN7092_c0_g1_i2:38-550(+)